MAFIVSADDIKKTLPGYDPARSDDFHLTSAKQADTEYAAALQSRAEPAVILMSGGTASGKTEYVSVYLKNEDAIVYDGTLPTYEGACIKIGKALKAGKRVAIHAVLPESFLIAFSVFLNRERKFADEHFYRTHSNARKTLLQIAETFPEVIIRVINSEYIEIREDGSMKFTEKVFATNTDLIEFLRHNQYTEEQIRNAVFHHDE